MSENNEWKKNKLSEEELAKAAGGTIFVDYECEKCGKYMSVRIEDGTPWCCGQMMKHVATIMGGV